MLVPEYLAQLLQSNILPPFEVRDLCKRLEAAYADSSNTFFLHQFFESSAFLMKQMCWSITQAEPLINDLDKPQASGWEVKS